MCSRVTQLVLLALVVVLSAALLRQSRIGSGTAVAMHDASSAPVVMLASDDVALPVADDGVEAELASMLGSLDMLAFGAFGQDEAGQPRPAAPEANPPHAIDGRRVGNPPRDGQALPDIGARGEGERFGRDGRDRERSSRDRDRDRGPWSQHGPRMLMNPEMIDRCLEVASEVDKELGVRLAQSRQKNPEEFDRSMRAGGFGRRLLALAELKQRDPDLYRTKLAELSQAVQIERTAKQLREARKNGSQGEIDVYENQLRSLLQIQLAMSIKARTELLCRLDERIAELRSEIERDAENFQSIIDARVKVLATERPSPGRPPQDRPPSGEPN